MRNPISIWSACVFVFTLVFAAASARGADLHLVVFADTLDPAIATDVDMSNAVSWGQTIAGYTGLTLRFQSLSGELLTATRGRTVLHALSPGSDDVVYFIYSGHGGNAGDSEWPTFTLLTGSYLDFDEVVGILQPKSQRLLVVIADCCNAPLSSGRVAPEFDVAQNALTVMNFQNLFLNFRGTVLVSSSAQGQYSLGDTLEGGLFLNAYMDTFRQMAGVVSDLTWQDVLAAASAETQQLAAQYGELQQPQYVVSTEQVAAGTPAEPASTAGGTTGSDDATTGGAGTTAAPMCGPMSAFPLLAVFGLALLRRR